MRWDLVGYSSHPIPDDPAVVASQSERLRAVAASMRAQIDRMPTEDQAGSLVWDSDAAEGFRQVVAQLPRDLGKLEVRYERVAEALEGFYGVLVRTKGQAEEGVQRAARAQEAIEAARAGIERMAEHARAAQAAADRINDAAEPGAPSASPEPWSGPDHHALLRAAEEDLARARSDVHAAVDAFRTGGDTAADAVASAADDDLKNDDSLWGSIKRVASDLADALPLEEIASMAGTIAAAAGVIALIPGLQWVGVIAAVAGVVALLANVAIVADKKYRGEPVGFRDWLAVGVSVVGTGFGVAAIGARIGARISGRFAGRAAVTVATTGRAATAARTTRVGAQRAYVAARRDLVRIQSRNVVRRAWSRITGRTGRAEARVTTTGQRYEAAHAAEQRASAAHRAAQGRHGAWQRRESAAAGAEQRIGQAGVVYDVVTTGGEHAAGAPPALWAVPGGATGYVVVTDVMGVVDFYDQRSELGAAADRGEDISAQPIRVP